MPAPTSKRNNANRAIAAAITAFLDGTRVTHLHFAENGPPPQQPLAYLVNFPRLYVTLSGNDAMWLDHLGQSRLLQLKRGDAVVLPANSWNRPVGDRTGVAINILFGRTRIGFSLVTNSAKHDKPESVLKTSVHGSLDYALRSIMHALLTLRSAPSEIALPLVDAILRATIVNLKAPNTGTGRGHSLLYESIAAYLQERFQAPLSRASVAEHFRVSPNHVSRVFKREGGTSFNDYVANVRLNCAKQLLGDHRHSIAEVASLCGFSDASYFCRAFKETTKLTPSEYRKTLAPSRSS